MKNENCSEKNIKFFGPPPRHMRQKNSAGIDGGLSGGPSVRKPGSEDPHRH